MDGRYRTFTFGLVDMTCATTAPTWLFISVKPHWLDAVLSDLNGLSAVLNVVTGPAPSVRLGAGRSRFRRTGSWRRPGRPRSAAASGRAATTAAASCAPPAAPAAPSRSATH